LPLERWLRALGKIGASPSDTDEQRLQKTLLVASTIMMASLAVGWGALYLAVGKPVSAAIPLVYSCASFVSLGVFGRVRRYELFRVSQLALSLCLPFFLMLSLGGFVGSGAVVLWSLTSPLGALVFAGRRPAAGWFASYLLLLLVGAALSGGGRDDLSAGVVTLFFVMNLGGVSVVAFVLLQYFVGERDLAYTVLDRERRWIHDAFSSYTSPNLVRHLLDHPDELKLGGESRECTFVLTDLAGFTSLVEQAHPEAVVELLNEYLEGMTRIALAAEGTLDRFMGDAVAVMFSAPVVQPDHAERAVRCALEMDRFATGFALGRSGDRWTVGGTRIGVCSGRVVVGHVGSSARLDYRAVGDAINTAKRLEDANRLFGTRVCVSAATVAAVPRFVGRPIGLLRLTGKQEPVGAWEALQRETAEARLSDAYLRAYEQIEHDAAAALAAFRELERMLPLDPLVRFHRQRLEAGEASVVVAVAKAVDAVRPTPRSTTA
jgi:class 3 adenylate cyclase